MLNIYIYKQYLCGLYKHRRSKSIGFQRKSLRKSVGTKGDLKKNQEEPKELKRDANRKQWSVIQKGHQEEPKGV